MNDKAISVRAKHSFKVIIPIQFFQKVIISGHWAQGSGKFGPSRDRLAERARGNLMAYIVAVSHAGPALSPNSNRSIHASKSFSSDA